MTRFATASRRAIMRGALGVVAGALAVFLPPAFRAIAHPLDAAVARLLPHRASARTIGLAYLAVAPGESSAEQLRERLGSLADAARIAEQVRADFAAGRVVVIDGWTLSLTEARACALVALT